MTEGDLPIPRYDMGAAYDTVFLIDRPEGKWCRYEDVVKLRAADDEAFKRYTDDIAALTKRATDAERQLARVLHSENQSLDLEGDFGRAANESSLDDVSELLEGRP